MSDFLEYNEQMRLFLVRSNYFLIPHKVLFGMSFFSLMMESIWTFGDGDEWYRSELEPKSPGATLVTFFSFLVIYNYVIPISLYVTVEMNRFISAFFISWDDHFHYRLADGEELQEKRFFDLSLDTGQIEIGVVFRKYLKF